MSFDWSGYLGFAQSLIRDTITRDYGKDAKFRTAVSRAYYAAHGIARERLRNEGYNVPRKDVHSQIIQEFRNSSDRNRIEIADYLSRLFQQRVKADYRSDAVIQLSTARFANKLADEAIKLINEL